MRRVLTIVVLPDSQMYFADDLRHFAVFESQIEWILANRETFNIRFVTHLGDIVQSDDQSETEWQAAQRQMRRLDGLVPYGFCPGNHDMAPGGAARLYSTYFPSEYYRRFSWWADDSNENRANCQLFSGNGVDFVCVHLQFMPTDQDLEWAVQRFRDHSQRFGILTTHMYLGEGGPGDRSIQVTSRDSRLAVRNWDLRTFAEKTPMNRQGNNAGLEILDRVVRRARNVRIVLSGHYGEHELIASELPGRTVFQFLANFQGEPNGGNGWLQLLQFDLYEGVIREAVFSPWLDGYWEGRDVMHTLKYQAVDGKVDDPDL